MNFIASSSLVVILEVTGYTRIEENTTVHYLASNLKIDLLPFSIVRYCWEELILTPVPSLSEQKSIESESESEKDPPRIKAVRSSIGMDWESIFRERAREKIEVRRFGSTKISRAIVCAQ
jgi:lipoate-protein ligase B